VPNVDAVGTAWIAGYYGRSKIKANEKNISDIPRRPIIEKWVSSSQLKSLTLNKNTHKRWIKNSEVPANIGFMFVPELPSRCKDMRIASL
jgi:hypothetical protein